MGEVCSVDQRSLPPATRQCRHGPLLHALRKLKQGNTRKDKKRQDTVCKSNNSHDFQYFVTDTELWCLILFAVITKPEVRTKWSQLDPQPNLQKSTSKQVH